jgi:hypothetical protein
MHTFGGLRIMLAELRMGSASHSLATASNVAALACLGFDLQIEAISIR